MTAHKTQASQYASAAPTAVVPDFIGQVYVDHTSYPDSDFYIAFGLSAGNWTYIGSFPVHAIDGAVWHTGVPSAVTDNYMSFDASGLPKDSGYSEASFQKPNTALEMKVYKATSMPTLSADNTAAIWVDTTGGLNKVYFVFRRGSADHVSVQLGLELGI